jgi:hypothetical protein
MERKTRQSGGRRSSRMTVELPCQRVGPDRELGDKTLQISAHGVLLRKEGAALEPGATVVISFRPPGSALFIDTEARVVRLLSGDHPAAPGVALELTDLSPFERELIMALLERRRETVRRPVRRGSLLLRARASSAAQRAVMRGDLPRVITGAKPAA